MSTTRGPIMNGFLRVVHDLTALRVVCDLLVDGSFLTEEIDPEDIDFAVCVTPEFYESCSDPQRRFLEWIRDDFTIRDTHF